MFQLTILMIILSYFEQIFYQINTRFDCSHIINVHWTGVCDGFKHEIL